MLTELEKIYFNEEITELEKVYQMATYLYEKRDGSIHQQLYFAIKDLYQKKINEDRWKYPEKFLK